MTVTEIRKELEKLGSVLVIQKTNYFKNNEFRVFEKNSNTVLYQCDRKGNKGKEEARQYILKVYKEVTGNRHIELTPMLKVVRVKAKEKQDIFYINCPHCRTIREVEVDANYKVVCENCEKTFQVKPLV